jgi:ClpX C4-type zinc finger protein
MWFRRLRCSFCRRSDKDVAKLVAGASGYICDRCAHEAVRIMETTAPGDAAPGRGTDPLAVRAADWNRTWHFSAVTD